MLQNAENKQAQKQQSIFHVGGTMNGIDRLWRDWFKKHAAPERKADQSKVHVATKVQLPVRAKGMDRHRHAHRVAPGLSMYFVSQVDH